MKHPWDALVERLPELAACRDDVLAAFEAMAACFRRDGRLYLCGNGGSAADAEHMAGELLKGFDQKRPLDGDARKGLPDLLAGKLQGALPAIPLTGFLSATSAFGNDVDPALAYAQLVHALGRPGDVLLAVSTSGNAINVCHACDAARARDMRVVGLTGRGGGRLAEVADISIRVPADSTHLAQELHLPVYHTLCLMLEREFF